MKSYERRFQSFENFTPSNISIAKLSAALFTSETLTSCYCILCKKILDNWEINDDPLSEHYSHQKHCPLFSLNLLESRCKTFPANFDQKRKRDLCKQGFIYYKIKEKTGYDLFCYKCGFYLNEKTNLKSNHLQKCLKRKRTGKFFLDNRNNLFYIDLISGRIKIEDYCFRNVYVPDKVKDDFLEIVDNVELVFGRVDEVLNERVVSLYMEEERFVDGEIEKIMQVIDKRFQEKIDEIQCKRNIA